MGGLRGEKDIGFLARVMGINPNTACEFRLIKICFLITVPSLHISVFGFESCSQW